jgi:hypothetical protein
MPQLPSPAGNFGSKPYFAAHEPVVKVLNQFGPTTCVQSTCNYPLLQVPRAHQGLPSSAYASWNSTTASSGKPGHGHKTSSCQPSKAALPPFFPFPFLSPHCVYQVLTRTLATSRAENLNHVMKLACSFPPQHLHSNEWTKINKHLPHGSAGLCKSGHPPKKNAAKESQTCEAA